MWELTQPVILVAVLTILALCSIASVEYIRLRREVKHVISQLQSIVQTVARKMECDDLIDQVLSLDDLPREREKPAADTSQQEQEQKRARLAAIVAGGTARKYLGKQLTLAQVDEMTDDEVSKHYCRYEARLGASMTKTLGASALQMYSLVAGTFLPIPPENQPQLVSDLIEDPFVEHALTTACCELYYRYGMYLAPLTAAMTTVKHCQFGEKRSLTNTAEDGRDRIEYRWRNRWRKSQLSQRG